MVDKSRLITLVDAYFGLSNAFGYVLGVNLVANLGSRNLTVRDDQILLYLLVVAVIAGAVSYFATIRHNKNVGPALGWPEHGPVLASVLMALNAALFCGVIGFIVVQQMISKELGKSGIRMSFFQNKKRVLAQIEAL